MKKGGCTYMITNKNNTVIYIGVTSALRARIWEHKTKFYPTSFTAKYNCDKIVWYDYKQIHPKPPSGTDSRQVK